MNIQPRSLEQLLVSEESSLRVALSVMDTCRVSTVCVVSDGNRLCGVVTEEDIRKALLRECALDSSVKPLLKKPKVTVTPRDGRAEVLDAMRALRLTEIPILEKERVVGIHVEDEILGARSRENWAVIMAGGRGTRLGSLTRTIPKPMLPVAGRPILERLVLHLVGAGVRTIFLSVNYLADIIEKHFGDGSKFGCTIEYLREDPEVPLGTGGPLRLLGDLGYEPTTPLLVMNGDLITSFSVNELLRSHRRGSDVATVAVSEYEHQVPFGVLESDGEHLLRIIEKPNHSWPINAGIYVIEPEIIHRIPSNQLFPITKLLEDCVARGDSVRLWPLSDDWRDIGRPNELAQARGQM